MSVKDMQKYENKKFIENFRHNPILIFPNSTAENSEKTNCVTEFQIYEEDGLFADPKRPEKSLFDKDKKEGYANMHHLKLAEFYKCLSKLNQQNN